MLKKCVGLLRTKVSKSLKESPKSSFTNTFFRVIFKKLFQLLSSSTWTNIWLMTKPRKFHLYLKRIASVKVNLIWKKHKFKSWILRLFVVLTIAKKIIKFFNYFLLFYYQRNNQPHTSHRPFSSFLFLSFKWFLIELRPWFVFIISFIEKKCNKTKNSILYLVWRNQDLSRTKVLDNIFYEWTFKNHV